MKHNNKDIRYFQSYTTEWVTNEISGHSWPEHTPIINKWEVHGGGWVCTYHRSEQAARDECALRIRMNRKFYPNGKCIYAS
jgi:hypothetical protein